MKRLIYLVLVLEGCAYGLRRADTADTGEEGPKPLDCSTVSFFGEQPDFDDTGTLVGRIASPSGAVPIAGAEVKVTVGTETAWAMSGAEGCFHMELPKGSHQLMVEKSRYRGAELFNIREGDVTDVGTVELNAEGAAIAVVYGKYDDVGALIGQLGIGFDGIVSAHDLYDDPIKMAEYEVIFANCGSDVTTDHGDAYQPDQIANLRDWIHRGGTFYASDLEHVLFDGAAPEAVTFAEDPLYGPVSTLSATVLDREVATLLGKDIAEITFNLNNWAIIEAAGEALPIIESKIPGASGTKPLAVLHQAGEGRMIYTSFHNEAQITSDMQTILYEVIMSL